MKSGVHLHAAVQQRGVPPPWAETSAAPQKSAADPFKAETLRIARRRRHRHPSNYPSHFLRPRARCFSRRLSVPGRWIGLMNLPLIRHQRDRANCFLRPPLFSAGGGGKCLRSGRELDLGGGKVKIWQHGRRDRTPRSALRGWEEKTESDRGCSCKALRSLSTVAPPGGPITPWPCTNFSCGMVR